MIEHNKIVDLVYNIIKEEATEDEPIDQVGILSKLQEDPDNKCDRRTVSRALDKLKEKYGLDEDGEWIDDNVHLHYRTVNRSTSLICKDYWFEFIYEDDFSDEELMFLMDAVQFSKHIDQKYAEEITGKLARLSHNRYSGIFEAFTNVNEKSNPVRKDIFLIIGYINDAIRQQNMISFFDNQYGVDKKLHRVSGEPVRVCPYKIVVSDGYYYLLCGAKNSNAIKSYRLDRITDVKIEDETFTHSLARKTAALHPNDYIAEHRYMNSGETVKVTLEIDRSILGDVIDSFGTRIAIDPAGDQANRLTVHVKSSEKDIIEWAMRYGENAVILDPDYLRNEIIDRARLITSFYREENPEIDYLERITRARRFRRLDLTNIDLNGREAHKNLAGVKRISLCHNGIKDFSFLSTYPDLKELIISHNGIETPEDISQLTNLSSLCLEMTEITDLDFLRGLDNLTRLTIHEFSLENIEALYSLPSLKFLTVNKPISRLIDSKRMKRAYGESFRYNTEDYNGIVTFKTNTLPSETGQSRLDEQGLFNIRAYSACEVTDTSLRTELCSMIYPGQRRFLSRGKAFQLVDETCDDGERTRLYEDLGHYAGSEYRWHVTFAGAPLAEGAVPEAGNVLAISVFKRDHGQKLVFMAMRNPVHSDPGGDADRDNIDVYYSSIYAHIRYLIENRTGWAELSGRIESYFSRVCTMDDLIDPAALKTYRVFSNIEIDGDDYHYYRWDASRKKNVKKICYGCIEIN